MYRIRRRHYDIESLEARCLLSSGLEPLLLIGRAPDLFGGLFLTTLANKTVPANGQVPTSFEIDDGQPVAAGAFTVAFYLSDDSTISTTDMLLTTRAEAGIGGNSSRSDSITLQLPATDPFLTDNNYSIGMIVDSTDAVNETDETNNSNVGNGSDRDFVKSERDLPTPTNGAFVTATAVAMNSTTIATLGQPGYAGNSVGDSEWIGAQDIDTFSFSASAGEAVAFDITTDEPTIVSQPPGFDTYIRLYPNNSFVLLAANDDGHPQHDGGDAGNSYLEFTFSTSAIYDLVVSGVENRLANPRLITGRSAEEQGRYDLTIHDIKPDLIGSIGLFTGGFIQVPDNSVPVNGVVNAHVLIGNLGYQNAGAFNVDVYLSDDATITTSDTFIAHIPFTSAGLNTTTEIDGTVTLPSPDPFHTDNQYYLGLRIDTTNSVAETDETNNVSDGCALGPAEHGLPQPTGSTVLATPAFALNSPAPGTLGDEWIGTRDQDIYTLTTTVANQNAGFDLNTPAGSTLDSYLRVYDLSWNLLASNDDGVAPLDTGTHASDSYLSYAFATAAEYHLVVSGSGDNTNDPRLLTGRTAASTGAYTITATAPDLAVTSLSADPADPLPANGQTTAHFTISNLGRLASPAITTILQIAFPPGVQLLGTANIPALAAGESYLSTMLLAMPVPPNLTDAAYNEYLINAAVDPSHLVPENNEGNNGAYVDVSYEADLPLGITLSNTIVRPKPTSMNATVSGDIGGDEWIGAADIDMFSFTATANEKIAVNLNRTSGNLDSFVRAYAPNFSLLASNDNGAAPGETLGTDSYLEFTTTQAGTYYLAVASTANSTADPRRIIGRAAGTIGAYTIALKQLSPPRIDDATFNYLTGPQSIVMSVNENVSSTLTGPNVMIQNLTTTATVPSSIAFDGSTNSATVTFPGQPDNSLPDGNYRMTIAAANVVDSAGNHLDGNGDGTGGDDYSFDFFFLSADANRDRVVNALDFNALASDFGGLGKTFAQGNFNYDGQVNTLDFNVLASRFNNTLAPIAGSPIGAAVTLKSLFSTQSVRDWSNDIVQ